LDTTDRSKIAKIDNLIAPHAFFPISSEFFYVALGTKSRVDPKPHHNTR